MNPKAQPKMRHRKPQGLTGFEMQVKLRAAALLLAILACAGASAGDKHLGVASCAGSACHGAARMSGASVRQDEYLLWQRKDQHAQAYSTLRTEACQGMTSRSTVSTST